MPFDLDSPFLSVPADLARKQVLVLDGIRYAVAIAELAHARLLQSLDAIVRVSNDHPRLRSHIAIATADVWTIVDSIHRLRLLITSLVS